MNTATPILVTGGAGYIGSHVCKSLAQAGYTPVTYDNLVYGHREAVKWGPFEAGDLLDRSRLLEVITRYQPAGVIHLAAYAYVGESVTNPAKYWRNNVHGSLELLEAMREKGVQRIVFSSTCASYGVPSKVPISEDEPQKPINPYGMSKLTVEKIIADYAAAYGMKGVFLRYFNAAGADPEGDIGEEHDPETHLIPNVLKAAAGLVPAITVFGRDYPTPDGTCLRDYIHVSDLAHAHVLALKYLNDNSGVHAFNLGNERGCSVSEVIQIAQKVTGKQIPIQWAERRAGDPPSLVAQATLARERLGWRPTHASMEDIIATAWAWMTRLSTVAKP